MSIHWAVIVGGGLTLAGIVIAVPSVVYGRRADKRAKTADARADAVEQRNAVRWQLELSRHPNRLLLRNIGTQDASSVNIQDPGPDLARFEQDVAWVVAGDAVGVLMNDPDRAVNSLMVTWSQPNHGTQNVPLPSEWLTAPVPQPEFRIEPTQDAQYRLRNSGKVPARGVRATVPDGTGICRDLPDGVDLAPGQSHLFLIVPVAEMPAPPSLLVKWEGHPDPEHVPVP